MSKRIVRSKTVRRAILISALLTCSACSGGIIPRSGPKAVKPVVAAVPQPPISAPIASPSTTPTIKIPPSTPITPNPVVTLTSVDARGLGVTAGPSFATLGISEAAAKRSLTAFRLSCPGMLKRRDLSGLTDASHWAVTCAAATAAKDSEASKFFQTQFEVVQVGDGKAFATGYFEPEIEAARAPSAKYAVPIYAKPPELVEIDLTLFSESLKGKKIRGVVKGKTFVPFSDRTAIETGVLKGRGLEIAWAADPIEFFFLQVQGSGRLRMADGSVMRIAYEGQNGHDYTGIGKLMRERGLLKPGQATMQGLIDYLRANPEEGRAIMRENRSWVFFRELTGPGPIGAMNVPVTGNTSVAADPLFVPLGAPVILSMDRAEPNGLWVAQDTGGAIKGSNRFDTFWGEGPRARELAGGMAAKGTAFLLLPTGSLARLTAGTANGGTAPQR
jgi:membrane-bound lytic murein transglycosylase A